jgi:hypothetical protein
VRRHDAGTRDEGLAQVRRVTRAVAAGALALTGVAAVVARTASAGGTSTSTPAEGGDPAALPSVPSPGGGESAPLPAPLPRDIPTPHSSTRGS